MRFKILSFDGGGIRALLQAVVLGRLESTRIAERADLLAGCSGGAIVAAGLAKGLMPAEISELLSLRAAGIFRTSGVTDDLFDLYNLIGAKYDSRNLKMLLESVFGSITLGQLPRRLLITSFHLKPDAGGWTPVVFHNLDGPGSSKDLLLVDALMRSTAAPSYFPTYQNHADGGLWSNNPAMAALSLALNPLQAARPLERLSILSLGTGLRTQRLETPRQDLGSLDWLRQGLIDLLLDGSMEAVSFYCRSLLGPAYFRLCIPLEKEIEIDDTRRIPDLVWLGLRHDMDQLEQWLEGFWV